MKRYCTNCEMITPSFTSWCSCRESEPGNLSVIFDYGESLGDIEIVRLLRVLRTAAIYEARRKNAKNQYDMILLKVAHNECNEHLKREAVLLSKLAEDRLHPMLPVLLPPYRHTEAAQRPYGKTTFQGETKYYIVYAHAQGDFLRDILTKNPQPWYQHAAWITINLADVVAFIHAKARKLILNLNPDSVLIRFDRDDIPRPLLMDVTLSGDPEEVDFASIEKFAPPAYVAPELLKAAPGASFDGRTDVYGLGLILYEMLAGKPAYTFQLRRDEDVRNTVRTDAPAPLSRSDLAGEVSMIVMSSIDKSVARRQEDVRKFAKALREKFGDVPAERKGRRFPRWIAAAVVGGVLALVVWTVVIAALTPPV